MMLRVLEQVSGAALSGLEDRLDMPGLMERLERGKAGAYLIAGHQAALIMSVGTAVDTGERGLWIEALGGVVGWKPHQNKNLMADVFADVSDIARLSGCAEIRIEANTRSSLKLRLFKHFGFEAHAFGPSTYMRKAL